MARKISCPRCGTRKRKHIIRLGKYRHFVAYKCRKCGFSWEEWSMKDSPIQLNY